jgi:hypothetical protein
MIPDLGSDERRQLMRILRWLSFLLITTGLVGFFGVFACTLFANLIPKSLELPLGDVGAITVDSEGRIYCSSQGYERIQEYDVGGHFIRGWACHYKNPTLTVDEADRLHIIHHDEESVYDHTGRLLEYNPLPYNKEQHNDPLTYLTKSGLVYSAKTPNLWPRITRTSPTGDTTTVINTPFYLWIIAGPLPGWLRLILGILILNAMDRMRRDKRESDQ